MPPRETSYDDDVTGNTAEIYVVCTARWFGHAMPTAMDIVRGQKPMQARAPGYVFKEKKKRTVKTEQETKWNGAVGDGEITQTHSIRLTSKFGLKLSPDFGWSCWWYCWDYRRTRPPRAWGLGGRRWWMTAATTIDVGLFGQIKKTDFRDSLTGYRWDVISALHCFVFVWT